jgi:hypothetical protein
LALALVAGACGGNGGGGPSTAELEAYCAVARNAELESWVGDIVTLCAPGVEEGLVTCTAGRVGTGGAITAIDLGTLEVRRVLPASGGRFVVSLADERLALVRADGSIERELAGWASDPWISADGERVAWIGLPDGVTAWDFGVPTVVAAQRLGDSARTIVSEDAEASAPRLVPGSDEIVYVSTRTGLASLWVAAPGRPPTQVTNVGLTEMDQRFVPPVGRELSWGGGTVYYSVSGDSLPRGGSDSVWRIVVGTGEAAEVGPGSWPRLRSDGAILAITSEASECAAVYPPGGTP